MTRELRKDITMLLKNKCSITGVIKYLLNKNIEPNEIIKELDRKEYGLIEKRPTRPNELIEVISQYEYIWLG